MRHKKCAACRCCECKSRYCGEVYGKMTHCHKNDNCPHVEICTKKISKKENSKNVV